MTTNDGYRFGPLMPLADAPRYTSLADVYEVIGQGLAEGDDAARDARLTEAIISCEWSIDVELGRSFPDPGITELATAPWRVFRPNLFLLPPADGELNVSADGSILEMSKTDANAVDQSAWSPAPTEIMVLDFPIIQGDVWLEIQSVTDTTFWSLVVAQVNDVIVPAEMDGIVAGITVVTQSQGGVGEIQGIPEAVRSVARAAAVSIYQSAAAPFGSSGSDDFLGTISVAAVVADAIRRNPQLMGFKVSWGVG